MSRFFINRPIVAMVIAILTVIGGLVAMVGLPTAQYPDIVPPQILATTTYTGADALTIESSVAAPLEQQMSGVDNMLYMQSTNANDGTMNLRVTFDIDTDVNMDQVNTQNRVAQAQPNLPTDVNNYGITIRKITGMPLLVVSLYSPKNSYDALFLSNYATINLNDAIYRVKGVGQITNFGASDYAMRIWVKPDKLAKLGFTVADLMNAVKRQNAVNPSGRIGDEPIPKGQEFTYTVRSQGRLVNAEEFGEIVVRINPDGSMVRLKDISRIELGALTYTQIGRLNGQPSLIIAIYQAPGSNAIAVANGVKAALKELKEKFPPDLDYIISLDTTIPVTEGIHEIVKTLFEATVLVIIVVFLFLQNWRATLIPLIAVPVSLIGTFAVFPMLGFSINTLSLFGLVLAIGLVVDDAIVVVEAVEHHISQGLSPKEATLKAMDEVTAPVIAIGIILSSVFIPAAFSGGITGRLNQQFAMTIAISVLISAFNALTLSPALSAMLLRPRTESKGWLGRLFGGFNRWFERMTQGYVGISHLFIRKAIIGFLVLGGFTLLAGGLGHRLPGGFMPDEDQGYFFLQLQLPDASSLQRTDAVCRRVEAILAATPEIEYYNTITGYGILTGTSATYQAFYFISLKEWGERPGADHTAAAVIRRLNQSFRATINEALVFAFPPPAIPGLGTAGGFSMWIQDRSGGDVAYLSGNLQRFIEAARKRPEIGSINSTFRPAVPQIYVDVDRDKVLKQGIDIGEVYQTMQAFMGGAYVNQFNRFGRQWKVFLQSEGEQRKNSIDIGGYYVRNSRGEMVPLSAFSTVRPIYGPEYTNRFQLFRAAQVTGTPAAGFSSGQALDALEQTANEVLPREMGYEWADMSYQEKKAAGAGATVFALSLVIVFLVLAALYESWSLPFSVLLSVPVAVFGAFLGLLLRGFDLDVFGQIGLIMLIGLAAKNAILIVEFAVLEHEKGRSLVEAALEGARLRLRPILMTSFAFILGCVPLWTASGAGSLARRILGTGVIVGMLAATGLAIFIIPLLYVAIERMSGVEKQAGGAVKPDAARAGGHG
ncbi:MAG TPA: multidrug efflux RND transporter permease subunit [Nitrospiria bacterium]|nr:multidrug efflux RND transporter permease subunit [Nitrospiria bacterium]